MQEQICDLLPPLMCYQEDCDKQISHSEMFGKLVMLKHHLLIKIMWQSYNNFRADDFSLKFIKRWQKYL